VVDCWVASAVAVGVVVVPCVGVEPLGCEVATLVKVAVVAVVVVVEGAAFVA